MLKRLFIFSLLCAPLWFAGEGRAQWGNIEAVYGDDNRTDWGQVKDENVRKIMRASVSIFRSRYLLKAGEYSFQKDSRIAAHGEAKHCAAKDKCGQLCPGNPFLKQIGGANCSGTLISSDTIVTAGHCFSDLNEHGGVPINEAVFVFGHVAKSAKHAGAARFSFRQIYRAKEFVGGVLTQTASIKRVGVNGVERADMRVERGGEEDWAVVRLDRPVPKEVAEPVKIRFGRIADGAKVAAIGYPDGLPMKYAPGAQVQYNKFDKFFIADLDTFHGNSGSGVFLQETSELVGILARGDEDYLYNEAKNCIDTNYCLNNSCRGEEVTRIDYALRK